MRAVSHIALICVVVSCAPSVVPRNARRADSPPKVESIECERSRRIALRFLRNEPGSREQELSPNKALQLTGVKAGSTWLRGILGRSAPLAGLPGNPAAERLGR